MATGLQLKEENVFKYMIFICLGIVIFITIMDILGARMFLALGEARHATYAAMESQYMIFFWVFTIAIVSFSSLVYYALRKKLFETMAVFIAATLFVLSGLEDILFYIFQGMSLGAVDLSHLYKGPAGLVTRLLFLESVTAATLAANAIVFVAVGISILSFLKRKEQYYEAQKPNRNLVFAAMGIFAVVIILFALPLPSINFNINEPLREKISLAKESRIGCEGVSLAVEPLRCEYSENYGTSCSIYITNAGEISISRLNVILTDEAKNKNAGMGEASMVDSQSFSAIESIEPGQRALKRFVVMDSEEFEESEYLKLTPSAAGRDCLDKIYWQPRSDWQISII